MRCPICGAKLYQKLMCPYCKITAEQIKSASNKKAKEYKKTGRGDLVHYTNVLPQDVSRVKLWLFTIFLGWCGVNHFIVGRKVRGGFSVASLVSSILMIILSLTIKTTLPSILLTVDFFYEIAFFSMAINVILWGSDIISLLTRSFKVPVVLGEKGENDG